MAKTAAERQAAYRLRRNDVDRDKRLNTWVTSRTHYALNRLANRYGVTQREMLERLVCEADDAILKTIDLASPEWGDYMCVTALLAGGPPSERC